MNNHHPNTTEKDVPLTRDQERELCLRWERETGKCSGCGHANSMHNELAYCRAKTSHDGSGPCICGMPNAENRRLHLTLPLPPASGGAAPVTAPTTPAPFRPEPTSDRV